ncbi:MAG: RecX family transcriptional regulator [Desulfotomaculum sp.]|nr:RecX family transcriptional regulator [Desulfotomaculum sp.]
MDFLKEYGLVDDYNFARQWVEYRLTVRPVGIMALKYELKRFGIDRELIEEVLNDIHLEVELNLAKELIKKKLNGENKNMTRKKMAGLLQRRGFSYNTIFSVLSELDKE